MPHGGKRVGAGRRHGSLNVRTRKIAEQAAAEGKTPLEVMLENMRHFQKAAVDAEAILMDISADEYMGADVTPKEQFDRLMAEVKKAAGLRQMAQECARDAASYLHPKLTSVAHTGKDGGPVTFRTLYEGMPEPKPMNGAATHVNGGSNGVGH